MGSKNTIQKNTNGFALLMTLIVVSVLISIGLVIVDLTLKQVRLSTNTKDSESAFHAANAGLECARYWRRVASSTMETGGDINPACFSGTAATSTKTSIVSDANGNILLYTYGFTWGTNQRCSIMSTLVMAASPTGAGLSLDVTQYIPGYPTSVPKVCNPGERCTVLASHGFNRSCATINGYGAIEREVLLQY